MGPLKYLTEQAQSPVIEASKAWRLAAIPICLRLAAASPLSHVVVWPNLPIVIWYGEELTG